MAGAGRGANRSTCCTSGRREQQREQGTGSAREKREGGKNREGPHNVIRECGKYPWITPPLPSRRGREATGTITDDRRRCDLPTAPVMCVTAFGWDGSLAKSLGLPPTRPSPIPRQA